MNIETLENVCSEHEKHVEDLEKEIMSLIKVNKNLEMQLKELEDEENLSMAWISAYPDK